MQQCSQTRGKAPVLLPKTTTATTVVAVTYKEICVTDGGEACLYAPGRNGITKNHGNN